jgi:predicted adenine nucleotide alpha hydrolase (AANH) superfamily ATPase
MKDSQVLNEIGEAIGKELGVNWLYSDFKKKEGYKRSTEISKEYDMYRQDYCGCVYSYNERQLQKQATQMED